METDDEIPVGDRFQGRPLDRSQMMGEGIQKTVLRNEIQAGSVGVRGKWDVREGPAA
jgi:hypothetical protein